MLPVVWHRLFPGLNLPRLAGLFFHSFTKAPNQMPNCAICIDEDLKKHLSTAFLKGKRSGLLM